MAVAAENTSDSLIATAAASLARAGIDQPLFEAQLLLSHCLGVDRHLMALEPLSLDDERIAGFELLLKRRLDREPMAYILGVKEFWSLDFKVGPGVLVPRPETETLVEAVLARHDRGFAGIILDLGCGSGILSVVLAREFPAATVVAVDCSEAALGFAAVNCRRHGVSDRVTLVRGDWGTALDRVFDLVVANPPYVAEKDRDTLAPELFYEPEIALFSGVAGFDDIRLILDSLNRILAASGDFFMEIGFSQAEMVLGMVRGRQWCAAAAVVSDLAGIPRVLVGKSRPGARETK